MTGPDKAKQGSGRCSGRVVSAGAAPTEDACPGRISAPESFTRFSSPSTTASPAERGPKANAESRLSRRQADRLAARLGERDKAILDSVKAHRFLTTQQLQRFHFDFSEHSTEDAAARICRRVLRRLHGLRVIEHLERRVGGVRAGSASYVWRVGLTGDQILRLASAEPRGRRKEPSLRHLEHCLAIADTHLALRDLAAAGRVELLQVETEPYCWRTAGGSVLKPDLHAVTASGEYEDHWFIEVDRATESLPTLLGKCAQYEDYRRTGHAQANDGVFPQVLWVVPNERHADKLRQAITSSRSLDSDLYRIGTPSSFTDIVIAGGAA